MMILLSGKSAKNDTVKQMPMIQAQNKSKESMSLQVFMDTTSYTREYITYILKMILNSRETENLCMYT